MYNYGRKGLTNITPILLWLVNTWPWTCVRNHNTCCGVGSVRLVFRKQQPIPLGHQALQSQEILNRPVFVLDILNRVWALLKILNIFWTLLKIRNRFWTFWTWTEQILNVTEHYWTDSEHYWKFWTDSEHSEHGLNIIFLLKSIYFTSFSLDFS